MPALAFYLDAPLQSWGASSKFQYRETEAFPSKSAIVGLVAAALGIDKHAANETEQLESLAALRFTSVRLPRGHSVRRLTDFHTIGGGYDKKAGSTAKLSIPRKASGAPFGTVITRRSYLTDAAFAAILEGTDAQLLSRIHDALLDPVWGIWLGRKTCLPATPLTPRIGEDRAAAFHQLLTALPGQDPAPLESFEFQEEVEVSSPGDGSFTRSDQPIAFGQHHGAVPSPYRSRSVRHHRPTSPP